MNTYYIDGQFTDDDKACISAKDITVLRGFGVFDFLVTYNRRPFHLEEHVERLMNSARFIGLKLKHTKMQICEIVEETVKKNPHHKESNVRIVYTGGISSDWVTPEGNGILMVMVTPKHILPDRWYTSGVKIVTVHSERFIPGAKSTNYISAILAQQHAKKLGAVEAVYVDRNNRILEGTTSNFYFFKEGRLITPGQDILPGITRSVILKLARKHFKVEARDVFKMELNCAEEAFISSSNREIVPVVKVNDMQIGNGLAGENTRRIMHLFREYTNAYGEGKILKMSDMDIAFKSH
jgi:branched-chain amino acid aminotransferase